MAIARDASSSGGGAGAAPKTWSHTCAAGSSLLVFIYTNNTTDDTNSVTYNGVALTKITGVAGGVSIYSMAIWYLQSPATGANTISVSSASSLSGFGGSYTGAAGGVDSFNSGLDLTPSTISMGLTTVADNCWQISMCANDGSNPSASTGFNTLQGPTGATIFGDSNAALTPAGAKSMDCTTSSGTTASWVTVALSPTAAAATAKFGTSRLLMGVGT